MRVKKGKVYIETNIEKLAFYYLELSGCETLQELKKSDYWKYYEQDKLTALRITKKREFENHKTSILKKDLFFKCSSCKKELGYQVLNSFVLDNLKFSYEDHILKITCSCGKESSFLIPKENLEGVK
ncbi:MAG: hypothetical protein ACRCW7_11875 [Cetobacterium sp.]